MAPWSPGTIALPSSNYGATQGWAFSWLAPQQRRHPYLPRARHRRGRLGRRSFRRLQHHRRRHPAQRRLEPDRQPGACAPRSARRSAGWCRSSGTATDDSAGVNRVQVLFGDPGATWQDAELEREPAQAWKMYYALPAFDADNEAVVDPTGQHSFIMRAYDRAGNVVTSASVQIRIDQTAPANTLTTPANIATQTVIGQPITIGGAVSRDRQRSRPASPRRRSPSRPRALTNALGNPLLLMPLDDPLGAQHVRATIRAAASPAPAATRPARPPARLGASAPPCSSTARRRRRSRSRR